MTCILTAMALIFMGFTINCLVFDDAKFIANTMKENNEFTYSVGKARFLGSKGSDLLDLKDNDLTTIEKETKSTLNPVYALYDNDEMVSVTFGGEELNEKPQYYKMSPSSNFFIEIKDNNLIQNLIGSMPKTDREIIIHKYFADYMIKYGILDSNNALYKPSNINEIISKKHPIKIGNDSVTISGIINDDDSLYKNYKNKNTFENESLYTYFNENYALKGNFIYVKGFTDSATLNTDKTKVLNHMMLSNIVNDPQSVSSSMKLKNITPNTNIITKNGIQTINSLEKNQIVLSLNDLKKYDPNINDDLNTYLSKNTNISYGTAATNFIQNYLNTNNIQNIKLKLILNQTDTTKQVPVDIIGITIEDSTLVSNQYIEEYEPNVKKLIDIQIYDNDIDNLQNVFSKFKISSNTYPIGTFYTFTPPHENDITSVITTYDALYKYILVLSLIFVLFAILLFSNFIGVSISYSKKK